VEPGATTGSALRYWLVVLALVLLGFLTIFSFVLYFWFLAATLIVLSPFRSRPRVFLPGLALALGFVFGYFLVAPWGCSQSVTTDLETGVEVTSDVVCTSPTGIEYPEGDSDPDRTPSVITGALTGVVAAAVTWLVVRSRLNQPNGSF
jgi:hypothetical protein